MAESAAAGPRPRMSPDPEKIGLFLIGARGAVATTVLHGLEGLRSGQSVAEIAAENGVDRDTLVDALVASATERINGWVDKTFDGPAEG